MLVIETIALLFALLCVTARNSCRQCYGKLSITFSKYVSLGVAEAYVKPALNGCATGDQFETTTVVHEGVCMSYATYVACQKWTFTLRVWRYCGNGGKALKSRSTVCLEGNFCASASDLDMSCSKSVNCAAKCDMKDC